MIKTLLKILLSAILLVVVLLVIAAAVLRFAINPNTYKAKLSEWVLQETGRTLAIHG